ncbi:P-loop containing nucleoside triphosphate hydrolase protein [Aulographum hederae CBS 113979]|uniref:P-loop containing nucleoside triphosphate hydrolase protein n=1 Tax=Aulographum hederae CBS 113979 TaxID=1176131 RepID=A0A6G1GRN7_9PEZI|nr:P-loop containing nucleoside triphosphate hydrolase protein [Aulographum hederae CBS 113979]
MVSQSNGPPKSMTQLWTRKKEQNGHLSADSEKTLAAGQGAVPGMPNGGMGIEEGIEMQQLDMKQSAKEAEGDTESEEEDPFGHLPEHEAAVLRKQLDTPDVQVKYFTLYRYATRWDLIILFISCIAAIISGAAMPLMTVVFGNLTGQFSDYFAGLKSYDAFLDTLGGYVLYFVYLAIGEWITVYISTVGFIYVGEHVTQKIREHYLAAMLRQNIGYFDKLGSGEITTRITADTNIVQDGVSEKVGLTLNAIACFITAFVIGFIKSWKLTLILTSVIIAICMIMGLGSSFIVKWSAESQKCYAEGGTVAEEVLSSIRNATAFNTQEKLARQYDKHLEQAEVSGRKMQYVLATMMAGMMTTIYLNYALSFWEGSRLLVTGDIAVSSVITILFAVMIGAFSLGNVAPNMKSFVTAVAAAQKIFSAIDRVSPIDPHSPDGKKLEYVDGTVELKNVKHIYPSRPEVTVMESIDLKIPAGCTTALVGASGSGKSTIVGLVERFYDPVGGQVLLDGVDLQELNVHWLRQQISLVQQEPVLFSTTIFDNIRHGLLGTEYEDLDDEKIKNMVIDAAKMANAHDFISALPEGYETNVGARGFLLSGGQKQRVAIARAMVSDPKILLLDEATSALDTKSEGVVQAALDRAAEGRTTIVIAHRLSTIKTADNIVVMQQGRIVEQGTHDALLERRGAYYNLVEAQRIAAKQNDQIDVEDTMDLKRLPTEKDVQEYEEDPDDTDPNRLGRLATGKSVSKAVLDGRPEEQEANYGLFRLAKTVYSFNKPEKKWMLIGLFFCIIAGGGNPTQAVFFAKSITALSLPPALYGEMRSQINFWAGMYFMLAATQFIGYAGNGVIFGYCSERLVHRARNQAFRTMLRQDIAFFDQDKNNAGALTTFLSTETTHLAGLSGSTLGTILLVSTTLVAALTLGIAVGWKLGLVCTATVPIVLACGFLRFWLLAQFQRRAKSAYESSAGYACEATAAIRTVSSLTREEDVWIHYHAQLDAQAAKSLRSILKSSSLYAFSQSFMFLCIALGFWYGGTLIAKREYGMFQFFVCFSAIIFGAQSAGTIFSFAPDMGKAKQAAAELQALFDRKPQIDSWSTEGEKVPTMEGAIEFRDVHFRYPTRPEQPVLRGLDLTVKPGQYVALVGASGCGKSTSIALLERFYDPLAGGIYVDGREISSLNINEYRSHLALVSQEPTLYQGTIRENILLGADREDVGDEEVEQACRDANIYDFVISLPDGFQTLCGAKGALLSGGQKQRIAIARALLRNPKILLLDEATSALDSESEAVVQAALDKAAKGRTTVAVAHRLSTIQNADCIFVFEGGVVVERGTHGELVERRGRYWELVSLQSLGKVG